MRAEWALGAEKTREVLARLKASEKRTSLRMRLRAREERTGLRARMEMRKMHLAWRGAWQERPGMMWFAVWIAAFLVYLGVGLTPAVASEYEIIGRLEIPGTEVSSEVAKVQASDGQIPTPDSLVGEFQRQGERTLLVGHATGVFADLNSVERGDEIEYLGEEYVVTGVETRAKSEIRMSRLLTGDEDELVLMTCAGEIFANGDATERLIVEAEKV